jgi:uncharacterized iron-regulated membrane protein
MSGWQRWTQHPQMLRWRRWLVQVHLWIGLAVGVYIVVLSVSGSAVVLRPEVHLWLIPRSVPMEGVRLSGDGLGEAVRRSYPVHEVVAVRESRRLESPVFVTLQREGVTSERLFDPYAARDLGLAYPPVLHVVEWVVDLHDNLLAGRVGRIANGIGALLVLVLSVTGAILWWPGQYRWRHGLVTGKPAASRRFARRLHNALGLWSLALLLVWAISAVYFAFPDPFEATIDHFDDDLTDGDRPGEGVLRTIVRLHFGRFGGLPGRLAWIALGLAPAVLFVTGVVMWWTRRAPLVWRRPHHTP